MQRVFVDLGGIAQDSAEKSFWSYCYYRHMKLLKELFETLVQYCINQPTEN